MGTTILRGEQSSTSVGEARRKYRWCIPSGSQSDAIQFQAVENHRVGIIPHHRPPVPAARWDGGSNGVRKTDILVYEHHRSPPCHSGSSDTVLVALVRTFLSSLPWSNPYPSTHIRQEYFSVAAEGWYSRGSLRRRWGKVFGRFSYICFRPL